VFANDTSLHQEGGVSLLTQFLLVVC